MLVRGNKCNLFLIPLFYRAYKQNYASLAHRVVSEANSEAGSEAVSALLILPLTIFKYLCTWSLCLQPPRSAVLQYIISSDHFIHLTDSKLHHAAPERLYT